MGKPSAHTKAARRLRGLGLGWSKGLLLACSLVCAVGSVTVYATAAAALAGQGEADAFAAFPGIASQAESGETPSEDAAGDGALAQTGAAPQGADGQPQGASLPAEGDGNQQNAPADNGIGGNGEDSSDQAASPAFPSVTSQDDKASVGKTANPASNTKDQDKKPGSSTTSKPSDSAGSSKNPASSTTDTGSGGTSSSNKPSGSTGGSSATTPSGSGSSGSTTSKPSTGTTDKPSTSTPPSSSDAPSSGLSEATEKKIHTQLTSKYNDLAPLAEEVAEAVSTFDATVDDASSSARKSALSKAKKLYTKASDASAAMQSLAVPAKSQYRASYDDMLVLYDDLATAADVLRRAWGVACGSVDVSGKTEPRQVMAAYSDKSGKLNALKDYEKRYPGARP